MLGTLVLSDIGDETWGAVLEDGRVVELHVENSSRPGIAGNVYKARVSRILPGMQAAFVDIGIGKDAFLQASDVAPRPPQDIDFEMDEADEESRTTQPSAPLSRTAIPILDLLREGQEILVQIARESIAEKGARVTARIALPGRALVFLPHLDRVFVSRRITDAAERERLRTLTEAAVPAGGGGWIVRTAAEGAGEEAVHRDVVYLVDLWRGIQEADGQGGTPRLVHRDLSVAERLLRDVISEEFTAVIVDSVRLRDMAEAFLARYLPRHLDRVRFSEEGRSLFDELGIHQEIERALRSRLWLKGGGSIVVNPTEALVAIDVNTGKFVGKKGLDETALRTNLQAVPEIARLLRLRDLGGIIVIDFIDMIESRNREILLEALSGELRKDRAKTQLLGMSELGLVQLTRKRTRTSLVGALQAPCPGCSGEGRIRSALTLYYEIQRELARASSLAGPEGPLVRLHPASKKTMEDDGLHLRLLASRDSGGRSRDVRVEADASLSEDRYEIVW